MAVVVVNVSANLHVGLSRWVRSVVVQKVVAVWDALSAVSLGAVLKLAMKRRAGQRSLEPVDVTLAV